MDRKVVSFADWLENTSDNEIISTLFTDLRRRNLLEDECDLADVQRQMQEDSEDQSHF
jgi:hypothetical protein